MSKKTKTITGLLIFLFTTGTAFAQATTTPPTTIEEQIACVGAAVAVREEAIGPIMNEYFQAVTTAYVERKNALNQVYTSTTTVKGIRFGTKAAWSAFHSSTKLARNDWLTARNNIWKQFRTSYKACKPKSGLTDSGYSWMGYWW